MRYAVDNDYWYTMFVGQSATNVCGKECDSETDRNLHPADDLPINNPVGEKPEDVGNQEDPNSRMERLYIYTHKKFVIEYNEDRVNIQCRSDQKTVRSQAEKIYVQIISVVVQYGNPVELDPRQQSLQVDFTYAVEWKPTTIPFENRFERLLETDFFGHKVHWLSICSSFMMVLFLTGLVSVILLRTIKRDYARYGREEDVPDFASIPVIWISIS